MDATNMIPAYSLVDDGDFYTMKTENGGVHYLLPELFPFFRSIHNQIYIYAMHPHPISGHIPPDVCVGCVFQPLSQFVVNGKQLFCKQSPSSTSPILRLSLTDFPATVGLTLPYLQNLQAFLRVPSYSSCRMKGNKAIGENKLCS